MVNRYLKDPLPVAKSLFFLISYMFSPEILNHWNDHKLLEIACSRPNKIYNQSYRYNAKVQWLYLKFNVSYLVLYEFSKIIFFACVHWHIWYTFSLQKLLITKWYYDVLRVWSYSLGLMKKPQIYAWKEFVGGLLLNFNDFLQCRKKCNYVLEILLVMDMHELIFFNFVIAYLRNSYPFMFA